MITAQHREDAAGLGACLRVLHGEQEGCVLLAFGRAQTVSKWIGEQNTHCQVQIITI